MTREDRITELEGMIAAANDTIKRLLSKTNQSVSFGDESYTVQDIEKIKKVRDELRSELAAAQKSNRKTILIQF